MTQHTLSAAPSWADDTLPGDDSPAATGSEREPHYLTTLWGQVGGDSVFVVQVGAERPHLSVEIEDRLAIVDPARAQALGLALIHGARILEQAQREQACEALWQAGGDEVPEQRQP